MNIPKDLRYTKTHEWAKKEGNSLTVGVTAFAQKEISDVVHVELPRMGREVTQGKACAVVESVKAAFDIYAPISGKVIEVHTDLERHPEWVNADSYEKGWFFKIELSHPEEWDRLLDAAAYEKEISGH